ncbi:MAG: DegT/DnrJ/EryC1/StrS family aminotransferase [Candidatus Hydrogenedentota bacterium]
MNVPLLDLGPQYRALKDEIDSVVLEVLASTQYVMGPKVEALEAQIAAYTGAQYAVGVTSGTDALLVSLMTLGVGPGDIVLTTAYSFFATAGTISRLNALPVFVDIDSDTFNINPDSLAQWFDDHPDDRDRVKAIMPVHLFGQCADMDRIMDIADRYKVPVIEDAAQAIGATYPGERGTRQAGTIGLAGCFSFFPSKNLGGAGDGGMVVTNDEAFANRLRMLRNHGMEPKYYHALIGGNFRLDPLQAVVLSVKLPHLNSWHEKRRANATYYDDRFGGTAVEGPHIAHGREHHIYNQYTLTVPGDRDGLRQHLNDKSIGHDVYYPLPFHAQECFASLGYSKGDFPVSEAVSAQTVALPIYPDLSEDQLAYVADTIVGYYA